MCIFGGCGQAGESVGEKDRKLMKIVKYIIYFLVVVLLSCSKHIAHTRSQYNMAIYPFMDWSNPDSVFHSYDTVKIMKDTESNFLVRFWIDQSSSVKLFIEIRDTVDGYKATKVAFGEEYNSNHKSKKIFEIHDIQPKSKWNDFINKVESIDFMDYNSRYHSWQIDGGPLHTPMIWFRVEYFNNNQHNDFVFWKFFGREFPEYMEKYEKIVSLIDSEFF